MTDEDQAGCCGCLLIVFLIPVVVGAIIFAFKLGVAVATWLVSLVS